MDMTRDVLITVQIDGGGYSEDMELSADCAMGKILPMLLAFLKQQCPQIFAEWKGLDVFFNGYCLAENDTLTKCGIWDGSIITIKEKGR